MTCPVDDKAHARFDKIRKIDIIDIWLLYARKSDRASVAVDGTNDWTVMAISVGGALCCVHAVDQDPKEMRSYVDNSRTFGTVRR